eukprot:EG_transcript_9984
MPIDAWLVGSVPALTMLLGGLAAARFDLNRRMQARLQNAAAGILLAGVAEMLADLKAEKFENTSGWPLLGMVLGFTTSGLALFSLQGATEKEGDSDLDHYGPDERSTAPLEIEVEEELCRRLELVRNAGASLGEKGPSSTLEVEDYTFHLHQTTDFLRHYVGSNLRSIRKDTQSTIQQWITQTTASIERSQRRVGGTALPAGLRVRLQHGVRDWGHAARELAEGQKVRADPLAALPLVPWSTLAAVLVDSASDGFLLGIAGLTSAKTAIILALGCALEMAFVNWTCCATLPKKLPVSVRMGCGAVPPAALLASCVAGQRMGLALMEYPTLYCALLSFGLASIIFLVTQELLPGAYSVQRDGPQWQLNVWLFVGMCGILVLRGNVLDGLDESGW